MRMFAIDTEEQSPVGGGDLNLSDCGGVISDMDDLWATLDRCSEKLDFLDTIPFSDFPFQDSELNDILDWNFDNDRKEIVHHDCMWAGMCSDRYHPDRDGFFGLPCLPTVPTMSVTPITPTFQQQQQQPVTVQSISPGQSLLINAPKPPVAVQHQQPQPQYQPQHLFQQHIAQNAHKSTIVQMILPPDSPRRPDTPQSLDEEDPPQFKHTFDINYCAPTTIKKEEYFNNDEEEGDDDDEEEDHYHEEEYTNIHHIRSRENTVASDHSYTLSKNSKPPRVELPGVQTPSDSEEEEEIDVVSLVEKKGLMSRGPIVLPTNPSPMARRQLQRTVASGLGSPLPVTARKRPRERSVSPGVRHRKRQKAPRQRAHQPPPPPRQSPTKRRRCSSPSDSEAENMERRSLHNDMERQRRIGLKNLFEELKKVVPSISQKDRTPKVVVLREAASLCVQLQYGERELERKFESTKHKQNKLIARVRQLRRELAMRRPQNP